MNKDIDYDALRNDLEDYYGTAMFGGAGMAMGGLSDVESASDDRLIEIAARERINLGKYEIRRGKKWQKFIVTLG